MSLLLLSSSEQAPARPILYEPATTSEPTAHAVPGSRLAEGDKNASQKTSDFLWLTTIEKVITVIKTDLAF